MQLTANFGDQECGQEHSNAKSADLLGAVPLEDIELGGHDSVQDYQ